MTRVVNRSVPRTLCPRCDRQGDAEGSGKVASRQNADRAFATRVVGWALRGSNPRPSPGKGETNLQVGTPPPSWERIPSF